MMPNRFIHSLKLVGKKYNFVFKRLSSAETSSSRYEYKTDSPHVPVMAKEVIDCFKPKTGQIYIDMTFGAGGHTRRLLEAAEGVKVIALDRDPDAIQYVEELNKIYPNQITPVLGKFSELPKALKSMGITESSVDGILFDFGCSSMQFDRAERGFSINKNGPLDMRMDKNRFPDQPTAADVLAKIDEADLYKVIKIYGEEKNAKKIAKALIDVRYSLKRIETTRELASIVGSCFEDQFRIDSLNRPSHIATKTFQALRIFVNNELNEINYGMHIAEKYLKENGRLVTLTFHSLEDTIVKRHIEGNLIEGVANPLPLKYVSHILTCEKDVVDSFKESNWQPMHKHVLSPGAEEIDKNPRSRSAKLRGAIKKVYK